MTGADDWDGNRIVEIKRGRVGSAVCTGSVGWVAVIGASAWGL